MINIGYKTNYLSQTSDLNIIYMARQISNNRQDQRSWTDIEYPTY